MKSVNYVDPIFTMSRAFHFREEIPSMMDQFQASELVGHLGSLSAVREACRAFGNTW